MNRAWLLALIICISLSTAWGQTRWYKGNTHTHTFWSDGGDFPETAADTYKRMGYHFLALSDHNVFAGTPRWVQYNEKRMKRAVVRAETRWGGGHVKFRDRHGKREVRLMSLAEVRSSVEEPGRFVMIPSVELTSSLSNKKQVHSNPVNIIQPFTVSHRSDNSVAAELALHERLVHQHMLSHDQPLFWHINHPNYVKSINAQQLATVQRAHGVEIFNASSACLNDGDDEGLPAVEMIWDHANALRLQARLPILYGCATDDTHAYDSKQPVMDGPGLAWIMVKSPVLTPNAITSAMLRGDFYSSTGITLQKLAFDAKNKTLTIAVEPEEDWNYTIRFKGVSKAAQGKPKSVVFYTTQGTDAVYRMTGKELFVRAVVTCDAPPVCDYDKYSKIERRAWTQPFRP